MGKKIDMKKSKTIEKIISDHLLVMTNESAQSTERGRDSGDYTEFNKYAMETLFLILRRLLVRDCLVENNEYDDTVILSGRGFIALGRETADFFNKKRRLFTLNNRQDNDTLQQICSLYDEEKVLYTIAKKNLISSPSTYAIFNLVSIFYAIESIVNSESSKIDYFTKSITRNLVLASFTSISLLYKLIEERIFIGGSSKDDDESEYNDIRKALQEKTSDIQDINDLEKKEFYLHAKTGRLLNPNDGSRNISFKVDTFNKILDVIPNKDKTILFKMGYTPGVKFGESFNDVLIEEGIYGTVEIVEKWFEFDSDVGFGKFTLDGFGTTEFLTLNDNSDKVGSIDIEYNFLKDFESPNNIKEFLSGYIQGVLDGIFIKNNIYKSRIDNDMKFRVEEIANEIKNTDERVTHYSVFLENHTHRNIARIIARKENLNEKN